MPVPSRKTRGGTGVTKSSRIVVSRFRRGRPFLGRASVSSI